MTASSLPVDAEELRKQLLAKYSSHIEQQIRKCEEKSELEMLEKMKRLLSGLQNKKLSVEKLKDLEKILSDSKEKNSSSDVSLASEDMEIEPDSKPCNQHSTPGTTSAGLPVTPNMPARILDFSLEHSYAKSPALTFDLSTVVMNAKDPVDDTMEEDEEDKLVMDTSKFSRSGLEKSLEKSVESNKSNDSIKMELKEIDIGNVVKNGEDSDIKVHEKLFEDCEVEDEEKNRAVENKKAVKDEFKPKKSGTSQEKSESSSSTPNSSSIDDSLDISWQKTETDEKLEIQVLRKSSRQLKQKKIFDYQDLNHNSVILDQENPVKPRNSKQEDHVKPRNSKPEITKKTENLPEKNSPLFAKPRDSQKRPAEQGLSEATTVKRLKIQPLTSTPNVSRSVSHQIPVLSFSDELESPISKVSSAKTKTLSLSEIKKKLDTAPKPLDSFGNEKVSVICRTSTDLKSQKWILETISDFSFARTARGSPFFKCLIDGCKFQSLMLERFEEHLAKMHGDSKWNKFCNICKSYVAKSGNIHDELQHMKRKHLKIVEKPPAAPEIQKKLQPKPSRGPARVAVVTADEIISAPIRHERGTSSDPPASNLRQPKPEHVMQQMCSRECLTATYKCMGSTCDFFTDTQELFKLHLSFHVKSPRGDKINFLSCAYCEFSAQSAADLIQHIDEAHKHDRYQCGHCFYRSRSSFYVQEHQKLKHSSKTQEIIKVSENPGDETPDKDKDEIIASREKNVPKIVCVFCHAIFYVVEHYGDHLKTHDSNLKASCIKCKKTANPQTVLEHVNGCLGIRKMQCIYCKMGKDTTQEMKEHMVEHHPSKVPIYCERTVGKNEDGSAKKVSMSDVKITSFKRITGKADPKYLKKPSTSKSLLMNKKNVEKIKISSNVAEKSSGSDDIHETHSMNQVMLMQILQPINVDGNQSQKNQMESKENLPGKASTVLQIKNVVSLNKSDF